VPPVRIQIITNDPYRLGSANPLISSSIRATLLLRQSDFSGICQRLRRHHLMRDIVIRGDRLPAQDRQAEMH